MGGGTGGLGRPRQRSRLSSAGGEQLDELLLSPLLPSGVGGTGSSPGMVGMASSSAGASDGMVGAAVRSAGASPGLFGAPTPTSSSTAAAAVSGAAATTTGGGGGSSSSSRMSRPDAAAAAQAAHEASENAWIAGIESQLRARRIPASMIEMIMNMLRDGGENNMVSTLYIGACGGMMC